MEYYQEIERESARPQSSFEFINKYRKISLVYKKITAVLITIGAIAILFSALLLSNAIAIGQSAGTALGYCLLIGGLLLVMAATIEHIFRICKQPGTVDVSAELAEIFGNDTEIDVVKSTKPINMKKSAGFNPLLSTPSKNTSHLQPRDTCESTQFNTQATNTTKPYTK